MGAEELAYVYWMVEFVQMKKDVKKEYLDEVIDPKHMQLNRQYLEDRIRDIWVIRGRNGEIRMIINIFIFEMRNFLG